MKTILRNFYLLLLICGFSAAVAQPVLINSESFEVASANWSGATSTGCTSYPWFRTTTNASAGSYSAVYNSYNAPAGCAADLYSPIFNLNDPQGDDSIYMFFDFFRDGTNSIEDDRIELTFYDSAGNAKIGPVTIHRYYTKSPTAAASGWVSYVFRAKLSDAGPGPDVKCFFGIRGISDFGSDMFFDNVNIFHIKKGPPPGSIQAVTPDGGTILKVNRNYNITWNSTGVSKVNIDYSSNGGGNWVNIVSNLNATPSTYSWAVPASLTSGGYLLRISDAANATVKDDDNTFVINAVRVINPNGGITLTSGSNYDITWSSANSAFVNIEYSTNGGSNWNTVANNVTASDNTYTWVVPAASSTNCKVRITDANQATWFDESDNFFTIVNPTVQVTNPNGGNTLNIGSNYNITWTSADISQVNIEYSTNGGANWINVASNVTASAGTYSWTVPNTSTTTAKVRISDASNAAKFDVSDNNFTISSTPTPTVEVVNPNGGNTLNVGSNYNIAWNSANISQVKIELSTNGGSNWTSIANNVTASAGTYSWTVPNSVSTTCKVRISDASNPATFDVSDNNFTIATIPTSVQLINPNGGNNLTAGTNYDIAWTSTNISLVNIDFSTNGGTNWVSVATNVTASANSYSWTVPAVSSTTCKVRISDASNAATSDASDNNFTISNPNPNPTLQVITPNGGNIFNAGNAYDIAWISSNVSQVNIDFSINGGINWISIASNVNASNSSYSWTVPATSSTTCKVRVVSAADATKFDESDNYFTIKNTTSVKEVTGAAPTIYPNPTTGVVNIVYANSDNATITATVYTLAGQRLHTETLQNNSGKTQLDASNLANGVYLLELNNGTSVSQQKLVISK